MLPHLLLRFVFRLYTSLRPSNLAIPAGVGLNRNTCGVFQLTQLSQNQNWLTAKQGEQVILSICSSGLFFRFQIKLKLFTLRVRSSVANDLEKNTHRNSSHRNISHRISSQNISGSSQNAHDHRANGVKCFCSRELSVRCSICMWFHYPRLEVFQCNL